MKKLFIHAIILGTLFSNAAFAAAVTGTIKELYGDNNGHIALKLHEGVPSDTVAATCPSYNGYLGKRDPDPFLKSMLLTAYTTGRKVRLSIASCDGAWIKIHAVYMQPE